MPAASASYSGKSLGNPAVELAPPNRTNNLTGGTKKNELRVKGKVEPHVDQTSGLIPSVRVGCGVIAARCSENTNWRRVCLDTAVMLVKLGKTSPGKDFRRTQKFLFHNLRSMSNGIEKRVIELDIEKCFDRISHSSIMERLIAPSGIKLGIFRCLKSGVNPEFPEQGTPQGGVVSPLLANIALNGIEDIHQSVRYADDMVFILKPKDDAVAILEKISQFLAERGMKVSEKKTKLTATTDGFDFLGWHFKVQSNGKFRCVPSVDNFKAFRKKVKQIVINYKLWC